MLLKKISLRATFQAQRLFFIIVSYISGLTEECITLALTARWFTWRLMYPSLLAGPLRHVFHQRLQNEKGNGAGYGQLRVTYLSIFAWVDAISVVTSDLCRESGHGNGWATVISTIRDLDSSNRSFR